MKRSALCLLPLLFACAERPADTQAVAETELRAATKHYSQLVLAMDSGGIAALFTDDGEISADGQPAIHGPASIRAHLDTFRDYHVLNEYLSADTVAVYGARGRVEGTYRQRVRLPAGDTVEVTGTYTALWVRDRVADAWRIRRMTTTGRK
jgi:hypothetical protein